MNTQRERCVLELGDVEPDFLLYACLVALMASKSGEHHRVESLITKQLREGGSEALVRSSAGALIEALRSLEASRVALVMPYLRPLAEQVVTYLENEGLTVVEWRALEVGDNMAVGCISGQRVMQAARSMSLRKVDALVLSCCVQMPSLDLIEEAERELGLPVLSAATAGVYSLLRALNLEINIPDAGSLLLDHRSSLASGPSHQ